MRGRFNERNNRNAKKASVFKVYDPNVQNGHFLSFFTHSTTDKELLSFLQSNCSTIDMQNALLDLSRGSLEERLEGGFAPDEYTKVWSSFLVARDAPKRDDNLKIAMRKQILSIQKEKNCSNYRVYIDLHLNPGNINSWLKNGDSTKVSYQTAEKIMNYVLQY